MRSDLVNLGIIESPNFPKPVLQSKSIGALVCGLPRGGTTAFARVLEQMGFSLGAASQSPVAEFVALHPPLKAALTGGPDQHDFLVAAMEHHLQLLSADCNRFAIKLPDYYHFLGTRVLPRGIDVVLFITRDPLCVAIRNIKSVGMDPSVAILKAVREYGALIDAINRCPVPSLVISYEKLLSIPDQIVRYLANSLGVPLTDDCLNNSVKSVVLNDPAYLKSSSLSRGEFRGEISYFKDGRLGGWCFWSGMPGKHVILEVYKDNGELLGCSTARRQRFDVVEAGLHPTGQIGFRVDLSQSVKLDRLQFVADGMPVPLRASTKLLKRIRSMSDG